MNVRRAIATFRGHHIPNIDFLGRRRLWFLISGVAIALSLIGLFLSGLNFSIDFKGGSQLQFPNPSGATQADYQAILNRFGLSGAKIEILSAGGTNCATGCVTIRSKSLTQLGLVASNSGFTVAPTPSVSPTPTAGASAGATPSASPTPSASGSASPAASPSVASPTPAPGAQAVTPRADRLRAQLAKEAGIPTSQINETDVGPTWGGTISAKAIRALIVFLLFVTLYISLRFELKMAVSALIALAHDMIITAGIYALVGREVTPETVVAILTILGYSLYDTVVIFDKIKENTESISLVARETYSGVVNLSLNQTLMRSVNTSLVVLLPIGSLLLFGGQTLKDFAFALFVGVASGTYSSIFVAAPVLALLKEREPRFQQIRTRAAARTARPGLRDVSRGVPVPVRSELEPAGVTAASEPERPTRPGPSPAVRSQTRTSSGSASKKKKGKPQGKAKRRRR